MKLRSNIHLRRHPLIASGLQMNARQMVKLLGATSLLLCIALYWSCLNAQGQQPRVLASPVSAQKTVNNSTATQAQGYIGQTVANAKPTAESEHLQGRGACLYCGGEIDPPRSANWAGMPQQVGITSGACAACIRAIDCRDAQGHESRWKDVRNYDFQPLLHGEYVGPIRLPSMLEYRLRVGDEIQFIYVLTREQINDEYRLQVGDTLMIDSVSDEKLRLGDLTGGVPIQADGKITFFLIGPIKAVGLTIPQLRLTLNEAYKKTHNDPAIDVIPIKTNTRLEDLRSAVDNRFGSGGQSVTAVIGPDGRIQLPIVGPVFALGMTLEEIKREVNLRYREDIIGLELEPRLTRQAQHFVFVYGEVSKPGRYELTGPTTVTQALAMAEGVRVGGNRRQIVIFRRADDWRMVATMLDLRAAHYGKRPNPSDEIWLRDSDLIVIPPTPIKVADNFAQLLFTEGIYRVIPFAGFSIQQAR